MTSPNIFTPPGQPTIEDQLRTAYESGVERRREAGALGTPRSLGDIATGLMTDYHETQARTEASRQERLDTSATSLHDLAKRIHPDTPTDQADFIAGFDITWDDEQDAPAIWPIDSESGERLLDHELDISDRNLTGSLSLPEGLRITSLDCGNNQLTEINLNAAPALQTLYCNNNQLTELNLDAVPALRTLNCNNNRFTELSINTLPALQTLYCHNNQLTELDLDAVPKLQRLYCDNNQLTDLNLDAVKALQTLHCNSNRLTKIKLDSLPNLREISHRYNPLTKQTRRHINKYTSQKNILVF